MKPLFFITGLFFLIISCSKQGSEYAETVFFDDFGSYPLGCISKPVGAHSEYHYFAYAQLNENWQVSTFYHSRSGADTAWHIAETNGQRAMISDHTNRFAFTHPMVAAGSPNWRDFSTEVKMATTDTAKRSGIAFRYVNDRQYYFFGIEKGKLVLLSVNHEKEFHVPNENILAQINVPLIQDSVYSLKAECKNNQIKAYLNNKLVCEVTDTLYSEGRIALLSDVPAVFYRVEVKMPAEEIKRIKEKEDADLALEKQIQDANPKPVVWKKIATPGFGVGRNLRFGDLNNDGETDILVGQVVHHAYPRDSYSELSCLTAITTNGEILWQIGKPDKNHEMLTNDVAFQIYDLDDDGRNEVIYNMNCEIIVADAATGKTKFKRKTPELKTTQYDVNDTKKVVKEWNNILGDCLFFCDLRGTGRPADLVIKNRYTHFWVLDEKLNTQWSAECRTGHYPYAKDTDGDGKEELYMGYSAFDWKGNKLWSLDTLLKDHGDGVGVVNFQEPGTTGNRIFIAGSDQGAIVLDTKGKILKNYLIGHVQNPAIANFRSDLPGLETVTVNFWGNQGIIHFFDSKHNIYKSFEPTQYGSMCLPINWNGGDEEFFVLNASVKEGGMYDGRGRKAVAFPNDGHPEMCNAVLDFTGDNRDEVVVWNPDEIWIYTQNDSPKAGKLYQTRRNALYNYSNYQLTVSEPANQP